MSCAPYTIWIGTQNELYLLYYINWHLKELCPLYYMNSHSEWAIPLILYWHLNELCPLYYIYELTLRMSYAPYTVHLKSEWHDVIPVIPPFTICIIVHLRQEIITMSLRQVTSLMISSPLVGLLPLASGQAFNSISWFWLWLWLFQHDLVTKRNEEILELHITYLEEKLCTYRHNWFWHVHRMEDYRFPKEVLNYHPKGRWWSVWPLQTTRWHECWDLTMPPWPKFVMEYDDDNCAKFMFVPFLSHLQ
jgi:hypothetical protein